MKKDPRTYTTWLDKYASKCHKCGKPLDGYHTWAYKKDDKIYCHEHRPATAYRVLI